MMTIKGKNIKLVLIDDDETAHFIFRSLMKMFWPDVQVDAFTKAKEVISLIQKDSFAATALILDVNMPVMNGWEFLEQMQTMNCELPVYMLSSSNHKKDQQYAARFINVRGYFVKPLVTSYLEEIIHGHLK